MLTTDLRNICLLCLMRKNRKRWICHTQMMTKIHRVPWTEGSPYPVKSATFRTISIQEKFDKRDNL
jgi:hypothetical protein